MRINRIKELREAHGWTMAQLAERAKTTDSQINKLEKGQRELDADWIYRLCGALGCRPDQMIPDFREFFSTKELDLLDRISALDKQEKEILAEINQRKTKQ